MRTLIPVLEKCQAVFKPRLVIVKVSMHITHPLYIYNDDIMPHMCGHVYMTLSYTLILWYDQISGERKKRKEEKIST